MPLPALSLHRVSWPRRRASRRRIGRSQDPHIPLQNSASPLPFHVQILGICLRHHHHPLLGTPGHLNHRNYSPPRRSTTVVRNLSRSPLPHVSPHLLQTSERRRNSAAGSPQLESGVASRSRCLMRKPAQTATSSVIYTGTSWASRAGFMIVRRDRRSSSFRVSCMRIRAVCSHDRE
jgi:hypothetical protein